MLWIVIAAGGAIGSMARHGVNVAIAHLFGRSVPYATATVNLAVSNVAGQTALGLIAVYAGYLVGVR